MRPKLLSLLAVCAVALVGCSAAEPGPAPANTPTASAVDKTPITEAEALEAEPSAAPEELFLDSIHSVVDGNENLFKGEEQKMTSETYWLDQSDMYCDQVESGKIPVEPTTLSANGIQLERTIISSSIQYLCPTDS